MWDWSKDYIRITLQKVEVEVSLGLHPWERHPERPTRLLVSIDLFAYQEAHNRHVAINYDSLRNFLKTWRNRPHTELLEELAEDLIAVCFEDTNVDACRVELIKPDIFNEAAGAGIEVYRRRER